MSLAVLVAVYIVGGVTFLPLAVLSVWYYSLWFLPNAPPRLLDPSGEAAAKEYNEDKASDGISEPPSGESEETGVDTYMTAWVTVTREYFIYPAGGPKNSLNPPEKGAMDEKLSQTESAYSSLYKLISNSNAKERKQREGQAQTGDVPDPSSPTSAGDDVSVRSLQASSTKINMSSTAKEEKKSGLSLSSMAAGATGSPSSSKLSKYYAVLKHGNILLYTNTDETKVKHVIVIANHVVMMWPPHITDAELFIKRNAICLVKRDSPEGLEAVLNDPSQPPKDAFFIYLDNCTEKEDFYFALIRASRGSNCKRNSVNSDDYKSMLAALVDPNALAKPLKFETNEIMNLILTLHSSEGNSQTRWFNAIIGRIFLAIKDTPQLEQFVRHKIVKKLSKVKRPAFLSEIEVRKVHNGHSAPIFTNAKLRDLTPEGLLIVEANMEYRGGFSVEIGTKAVLNLGQRFKKRDVSLILAVTIKKMEGRMILKIKPPPSNRMWYAFETMPKVTLGIEPVVSTKQITYSIVTKAIESRILEVIKETVVMPFMDDLTFLESEGFYKGGLWQEANVKVDEEAINEGTKEADGDDYSDLAEDDSTTAEVSGAESSETRVRYRHKKSATFASFSSDMTDTASISSFGSPYDEKPAKPNLSEHIGELKGFGFTPESRSSAKNLYGSFKKWGSWYINKEKSKLGSGMSQIEETSHTSAESSPTTPIQAPLPHTFPPEILSELKNGEKAHYAPAEMKLPVRYPAPEISKSFNARRMSTPSNHSMSSLASNEETIESSISKFRAISEKDDDISNSGLDNQEASSVLSNSPDGASRLTPYDTHDSGIGQTVSEPPKSLPRRKPVGNGDESGSSTLPRQRQPKTTGLDSDGDSSSTISTIPPSDSLSKRRTSGVSIEADGPATVGFQPCPPTAATSTTAVVASQRKMSVKRKEVGSSA